MASAGRRRKSYCVGAAEPCECRAMKCHVRNQPGLGVGGRTIRSPGRAPPAPGAQKRGVWFPSQPLEMAPQGLTWSMGPEGPSKARDGGLGISPTRRRHPEPRRLPLCHLVSSSPRSCKSPVSPPDKGVFTFLKKRERCCPSLSRDVGRRR